MGADVNICTVLEHEKDKHSFNQYKAIAVWHINGKPIGPNAYVSRGWCHLQIFLFTDVGKPVHSQSGKRTVEDTGVVRVQLTHELRKAT